MSAEPGTAIGVDDDESGVVASFAAVWQYRRWRWLLGSTLVSLAGDFLYWVSLAVFLTDQDDPAFWLAASFVIRLLPWVAFGPIGGALADRLPRRPLLVGLDLARSGLFVIMAITVAIDAHPAVVLAVLFLVSTCSSIYRPARVASIPQIVPESNLPAANAAEEGLAQIAWFVGPVLGAVLLTVFDPSAVLAINAATFVVSAAMVARVGDLGGGRRGEPGDPAPTSLGSEVREGARILVRDRGLRGLAIISWAACLAFGAEQVLYVLVASDRLDLGAEGVGYLLAAMGVGGVLAAPLSATVGNSRHVGWWLVGSASLAAVPLIAISFTDSLVLVLAVTAVEGAAAVVFEVVALTLMQRAVDESTMGRVSGVLDSLATIGQTLGSVIAPVLVATADVAMALRVAGGAAIALILLTTPAALSLAAATDERRRRYRATARLLGATTELAPLEQLELERLARNATETHVPAGTDVIVAGADPDDVYVVTAGTLRVTLADDPDITVPDLGPGDLFGEIGLLRAIPRTATVTASTDVDLLAVDGSIFLAAVMPSGDAASPAMSSPLMGTMFRRLNVVAADPDGPALPLATPT